MFVVLEGTVNIYTGDEKNDIEPVIDLTHYQFTGELNMLNDQRTLVGARTTVDSVLLRVTRDNLQRLMRAEGEIANLIMQAFIWRRIGLASQARAGVILIGHDGDAETLKLQQFLTRNGYPHRVVSEQAYESSHAITSVSAEQHAWPPFLVFASCRDRDGRSVPEATTGQFREIRESGHLLRSHGDGDAVLS
jgi:thioredoxin reductase (NADPH)